MGITAILMAIEMLFAGLAIGGRERDHGKNGGSQDCLGHRHHGNGGRGDWGADGGFSHGTEAINVWAKTSGIS